MLLYTNNSLYDISWWVNLDDRFMILKKNNNSLEFPSKVAAEVALYNISSWLKEGLNVLQIKNPLDNDIVDKQSLLDIWYIYVVIKWKVFETKESINKELEFNSYESTAFKSKEEVELYIEKQNKR